MKLQMMQPRLKAAPMATVKRMAPINPVATPRQRGRKWMERRAAWLRAHPLCEHCQREGRITAAREVDHIMPLCQGGRDDESNYSSLCVECHKVKTAIDLGRR